MGSFISKQSETTTTEAPVPFFTQVAQGSIDGLTGDPEFMKNVSAEVTSGAVDGMLSNEELMVKLKEQGFEVLNSSARKLIEDKELNFRMVSLVREGASKLENVGIFIGCSICLLSVVTAGTVIYLYKVSGGRRRR